VRSLPPRPPACAGLTSAFRASFRPRNTLLISSTILLFLVAPIWVSARETSSFLFKPITLTALAIAMSILAYIAMSQDVLEEGRSKQRLYVLFARSPTRRSRPCSPVRSFPIHDHSCLHHLGNAVGNLQGRLRVDSRIPALLDDSIPRRAVHQAASSLLARRVGG
jgi:hypothetical protein